MKGKPVVITSFITFLLISTLQSCAEARAKKEAESTFVPPEVKLEDILKPSETEQPLEKTENNVYVYKKTA